MNAEEVSEEIHTTTSGEGLVQFQPSAYKVIRIRPKETHQWLMKKHYAKRKPSITDSFGLLNKENIMLGVCVFGIPPAPTEWENWKPYMLKELNRLCVTDDLPKNTLSFLVSKSLKMLDKPVVVISYADVDWGHHGYIYQATNWLYTGVGAIGVKSFIMNDGTSRHSTTYAFNTSG